MLARRALTTALALSLLAALPLVGTSAAPAAQAAETYTSYAQLQDKVAYWARRGAVVDVPGRSLQGRDLYRVRLGTGPTTILVTGRLHANEPSGTEAFVRLADVLLGDARSTFSAPRLPGVQPQAPLFRALTDSGLRRELLRRVTIVGFPMMDPDGAEAGNVRNQLLNLDYTTRLSEQTRVLAATFAQFEPDLYVDLHGGPNAPDLNLGYIEPDGVEPAVRAAAIDAARTAWRAVDPLGISLAYFEEAPASLLLGQHGEPFRSVDRAYYDALTSVLPLTQQGFALQGYPSVYTETVGLQSTAPTITVLEGASAQQAALGGLALEMSGLLTRERARKVVRGPGVFDLRLPRGARDLRVVVHWGQGVAGDPSGPAQDYSVRITAAGTTTTNPVTGPSLTRRSRAASIAAPGAGPLRFDVAPRLAGLPDGAVVRVTWREPDPRRPARTGVLGDPRRVAYCQQDSSLWDAALPQYSGPACAGAGTGG